MSNINSNLLVKDFKNKISENCSKSLNLKRSCRQKILLSEEKIYKYNIEIDELTKLRNSTRLEYNVLVKNLNFEKKYEQNEIKKLKLPYFAFQDKLEESQEEYTDIINRISEECSEKIDNFNKKIKQCRNLIDLEEDKIKRFRNTILMVSKEHNKELKEIIKDNKEELDEIKSSYKKNMKLTNDEISYLKKQAKLKQSKLIKEFKKENPQIKFVKTKLFIWNTSGIKKLKNKDEETLYKLYVDLNNLKKELKKVITEKLNLLDEECEDNKIVSLYSHKKNLKQDMNELFFNKIERTQKNVFMNAIEHVGYGLVPLLIIISFLTLLFQVILPIEPDSYGLLSKLVPNASEQTIQTINKINTIFNGLALIGYELMPILIVILMSICLGNYYKVSKMICLLLSISTYLILAPSIFSSEFSYGVKDLFSAFLGTYITIKLYSVLNNLIKVKIVSVKYLSDDLYESINSIILFLVIMLLFSMMQISLMLFIKALSLVDQKYLKTNVVTFNSMLSIIIQAPLLKIYNNYGGFVLIVFLRQLLTFVGFNDKVLFSNLYEVQDSNLFYNYNAILYPDSEEFAANRSVFTAQFLIQILDIGGPGGIIAVVVLNIIFSKEKSTRLLSFISLFFVLFNINDLFFICLPLVFNLILFIPYVLSPLIIGTISYVSTKIGIMPYTIDLVSPKAITIFAGAFATKEEILILWWFIIFGLYLLSYLPFMYIKNKLYIWEKQKNSSNRVIDANLFDFDEILKER